MKTTHTPGPWKIDFEKHYCGVGTHDKPQAQAIRSGRKIIAAVLCAWRQSDTTADANARLIAAAPELLEALKASLELHLERLKPRQWCFNWLVEPLDKCPCTICKIRSAITKAEGN